MASDEQQRFASAVDLLQGTKANYGLCWASMIGSVALGIGGIVLISEETGAGLLANRRALACQSLLFLIAQSFTMAKVCRDKAMFEATTAFIFAKPTLEYIIQVAVGLAIALGCAVYSLTTFSFIAEFRGFFAMVILWVTCNSLCLSKAVRDRSDAEKWRAYPIDQQPAHLQDILKIARGTIEYRVLVGVSALSAVLTMLGFMWFWGPEVLAIERKGFITACVLWCEGSSFHLAKLVRDRQDPLKGKELEDQKPFQALVIGSSLLSTGLLLVGIIVMPLEIPKKLFLITGAAFVITTAFFLAKNVRDRLEARKLSSPISPGSGLPLPAARADTIVSATSPMVVMMPPPARDTETDVSV